MIGGNCTVFNYIEHIPAKRRQSFGSSGSAGRKAVIACYFGSHPSLQSLMLKCLFRCCSLWDLPAEKGVACYGIVIGLHTGGDDDLVTCVRTLPSDKVLLTLFLSNRIRRHLASLTRQLIMLAGRKFRDFGNSFSTPSDSYHLYARRH